MEERATEKQINFAKKLGIETPDRFTKHNLRSIIDAKVKESSGNGEQKYAAPHTEGYGAPVEKIFTNKERIEAIREGIVKQKEYHLSPEQVRSNALACAIQYRKDEDFESIMSSAKEFEEWINGNN